MTAIRARGWGWRHAGRSGFAVRDLDLTIERGERVLLLGPSGSGKSTLLAGIAGVLGGDEEGTGEGLLEVHGRPAPEARGLVGLVLQDPDAQMILERIGDDTAFGPENLGVPRGEIWRRVAEAQSAVGLALPRDRRTDHLSGGQKQRLAIAGVLAMRPRVLLLDEPTANLDPAGAGEVRDAVVHALDRSDAAAVIVEHRVDLWWEVATRVIVLAADGSLVADGSPVRVLREAGGELRRAGVWLPGARVPHPEPERDPGAELLRAHGLRAARVRGEPVTGPWDLVVREGEALAVTGPNGSGKSSLALTLGGLLPPESGTLLATPMLAGDAGPHPHAWRSRQLLPRIGSVFQNPEHQFVARSVRRELEVGPRAVGEDRHRIDATVEELLDRLDLRGLADASPFSLSGGQKRRLSVGTALAAAPRMLVLDEPTFGQDARGWSRIVRLLNGLAEDGRAIVVVTHDPLLVAALGARELDLAERVP